MIKHISTNAATPPGGHYSQAVQANGLIFVSGQLGFDPGTTEKSADTIEQETENCLKNIEGILVSCGSGLGRIVKTTVYISDVKYWPRVNSAYSGIMGSHRPARAIVPSGTLHYGFNVEIEAIALA